MRGGRDEEYFNSQPHKEADVARVTQVTRNMKDFNSQPHKEADQDHGN